MQAAAAAAGVVSVVVAVVGQVEGRKHRSGWQTSEGGSRRHRLGGVMSEGAR